MRTEPIADRDKKKKIKKKKVWPFFEDFTLFFLSLVA